MMVPQFPEVFGVLRNVTHPTYEELQAKQAAEVTARKGKGDLEKLFRNDDLWVVE
jgi:2-oxoglutarate ferredoxin oxidoreductase subunit beta